MSVAYKLMQCANTKSAYNGYYYAKAVITDETKLATIAERIQRNCSVKKSDVVAVLTELTEVIKDELQTGHKVTIDGLGSFKIGIKGTYAKTALAFNAGTNITGYKVNFRPTYTVEKTGTTTDADGNTVVKKAAIADLTEGIEVKQY